jgi:carbonic anhydrase
MQKLIQGVQRFQETVFPEHQGLFETLEGGQSPHTLFITCSDSRIDPALLTQTEPGELFVVRNAGNIVPRYGAGNGGGEAGTIEYAIVALGIENIVVCGHSHCGAMKGLLHPEAVTTMPLVADWLYQAEETRRQIGEFRYSTSHSGNGTSAEALNDEEMLAFTVEQNVLVQLAHLRTYPAVADAIAKGKLNLYGWVYHFENGQVDIYDPQQSQFVSLTESTDSPRPQTHTTLAHV